MSAEAHPTFAQALRAAIHARGLGLDRIRSRLGERGVSVSMATLSYWQSGRSRPERRESLIALRHLEDVLQVPTGSLAALLPPPKARGRARLREHRELATYWPVRSTVDDVVRGVDTRWDERLARISQHDIVTVGAERGEVSFVSRQVLRAEADGPDRWVVILHIDEHDRPLPRVRPLRNCRLGRVVGREGDGLLVAELVFDRPLFRGETVITEHVIENREPYPLATNYERKFRFPVREYALEVCFQGELPVSCERYTSAEDVLPVRVGPSVHGVALDFGPGCYGFRWVWGS
ncbi:XRE family transcriptional regulator [Labedaea rhizosphaerae]|uniref:Uncharacterized protein n=1 Tax=Labedaea rhizosphaerae TaxID=598644 RepID=A0A4R6SCU5_LABRH|nr:XRE family transcriptional regulator [Labedaea rhizosphaerae]TDP97899.1 hypothetical protein EV186_103878 [Labedaea rhizosphaerae]